MTNIEPGTPIVKSDGDTANETGNSAAVLSDTEFADRLEVIAKDIETFERTRRKMILRSPSSLARRTTFFYTGGTRVGSRAG